MLIILRICTNSSISGKGSGDKQQKDKTSKSEDSSLNDKVKLLIEMTQRSEDEVCLALHECDNDVHLAAEILIEREGTVSVTFIDIKNHSIFW